MATGRLSKKAKRLEGLHEYLHEKVEDVEKERANDRSYNHKAHLINLKKQKLAVKDQLDKDEQRL